MTAPEQVASAPGIFHGLDFATYRRIGALNFSLLKHILTSPAHFRAAQRAKEKPSTPDQLIGNCVDSLLLEGKEYPHCVKPEGMSFATKEGKAFRDAATLPIMAFDERQRVDRMVQAARNEPEFMEALNICDERKVVMVADYSTTFTSDRGAEKHGTVRLKCQLDACKIKHRMVGDLKKTVDASPLPDKSGWGASVYEYGYLLQLCVYETVFALATGDDGPIKWAWLAIQDSDPAVPCIIRPTEAHRELGRILFRRAIERYLRCQDSGQWCLMNFEMPRWAEQAILQQP